jgi:parvulin-like peptidyl-prolyl isomerase
VLHDHDWTARGRRRAAPAVGAAVAALAAWLSLMPAAHADETPAPATSTPAAGVVADPVIAQRGDIKLTASQVRDMIRLAEPEQRHLLETNSTALQQAVRDRMIKLLLLHEAQTQQWDKREEVAYRAELARQDVIVSSWVASQVAEDPNFPTEDQIKATYDANKGKIMIPRQYHVAQIFLGVPPEANKQADDDAQRRLADLRQQVLKQHADFAVLAKRFSDDKASGVNGGDLGWVREDALMPQIRTIVQTQAEGSLAEPVRGPTGWHLIKLVAVKPASAATLAEAREALVRAMRQERQAEGQRSYLAGLIKQQPIEMNEIELSKLSAK